LRALGLEEGVAISVSLPAPPSRTSFPVLPSGTLAAGLPAAFSSGGMAGSCTAGPPACSDSVRATAVAGKVAVAVGSGRAEQRAALGQMAAAMAHELRNPLTAMRKAASAQERPGWGPKADSPGYPVDSRPGWREDRGRRGPKRTTNRKARD